MSDLSRREFVVLAAAAAAGAPYTPLHGSKAAAITAQEIVDRVRANLGVEWKAETVDTFKAGDPATAATGIVTTAMATIAVLRQAVKSKANVVISCEPTFYARADSTTPPSRRGGGPDTTTAPQQSPAAAPDPVFIAKRDFIEKHGLVVWRFSDHWRLRRPNPFATGLIAALGWSATPADPARASIREITLGALASQIKSRLNARGGIRVVGDRRMHVRTVGVLPGSTPIQAALEMLPGVDAIVAGEMREWESVEYVRDTVTAGGKKGLILVGRLVSEEPAMNVCAQWLKTLVPELTTTWISAGDPYWSPRS